MIQQYDCKEKSHAGHTQGLTLKLPDQICNSPYCRQYHSYNVSSENLI